MFIDTCYTMLSSSIGAASAHTQMSLLTELETVIATWFYKHCAPTERGMS
jgi:hypothetical protein